MAINAFASQTEVHAYLMPDLIRSTARYWSRFGGGVYAEAFEVVREAALTAGQRRVPAPGLAPDATDTGSATQDGTLHREDAALRLVRSDGSRLHQRP